MTTLEQARTVEEWVTYLIENATISDTGCWICHLAPNAKGYANVSIGGRKGGKLRAHRLIYAECVKPIPDGLLVLHSCDVPNCINPEHLSVGTHKDNTQDMMSKGRHKWEVSRFQKNEQDRKLMIEFHARGFSMAQIASCLLTTTSTVFNYVSPKGPYYVSP